MNSDRSESQSSRGTEATSSIAEDAGDFGLDDILIYLTHKLKKLSDTVHQYQHLEDNIPSSEKNDVTDGKDMEYLNYKMQFLNCLRHQIRLAHPQEWTRFPNHIKTDAETSLKKEVQNLKNLLIVCEKNLDVDKEELARLEEYVKNLQEMTEERAKNAEIYDDQKPLKKAQRNLSQEFVKHRTELNDMLTSLFAGSGDGMKEVLRAVCESYFDEDGDPYITVESDAYPCIEMLLEANIITRHPHDVSKIRLTNFLQ